MQTENLIEKLVYGNHQGLPMKLHIKWLARDLHIKFYTVELLLSSQSGMHQSMSVS